MFGTQSGGAGTTSITSITRAQDGTTATAHANGTTVELYQLNGIPLDQINKTHTAIANQNLDYYTITTTTSADEFWYRLVVVTLWSQLKMHKWMVCKHYYQLLFTQTLQCLVLLEQLVVGH